MESVSTKTEEAVVDLKSVHIFRDESVVLADVNIKVRPGEFCYLIGRTGSGKSTLLKAMYGAISLQKGHALVTGSDLTALRRRDVPGLRRKLGMVFQDFRLLGERNVHDNLDYVLRATGWKKKQEREERIEECLRVVDLLDKLKAFPDQLSGGEQQRVAIARAILNAPRLIIADEPTGNLDPQTSDEIMYLFHRLSSEHNTAVFLATHDYRIIDKFPARIYRCVKGQIFEEEV